MRQKDIHQTKALFAEKILELGNLVVVALVFSQVLGDKFDKSAASIGIVFYLSLIFLAYKLLLGENKNANWTISSSCHLDPCWDY